MGSLSEGELEFLATGLDSSQSAAAANEMRRRALVSLATQETLAWYDREKAAADRLRSARLAQREARLAALGADTPAHQPPVRQPQPLANQPANLPQLALDRAISIDNLPTGTIEWQINGVARARNRRVTNIQFVPGSTTSTVEYADRAMALAAVVGLNNYLFNGSRLRVAMADGTVAATPVSVPQNPNPPGTPGGTPVAPNPSRSPVLVVPPGTGTQAATP